MPEIIEPKDKLLKRKSFDVTLLKTYRHRNNDVTNVKVLKDNLAQALHDLNKDQNNGEMDEDSEFGIKLNTIEKLQEVLKNPITPL